MGPSLEGLFAQSNFGIVTAATIELIPKQEMMGALLMGARREEDLPAFVDALADLRLREIIPTAIHLADRERSRMTVGPLL